jgi:hypothetical protein
MPRIRVLKPNVTEEEARELFASQNLWGGIGNLLYGELRSLADFYIPFRIFQVEVLNRGETSRHILGLDSVTGSLDPYHFDQLPDLSELVMKETRNLLPVSLSEEDAQKFMVDKVRRLIFSQGFFRVRNFRISAEPIPGEVYVPYWAGFRGRGGHAHVTVLDAMRRKMEGARVRQMLRQWLTTVQ